MRDHVRLRCWPLEASSPPRAGRASCGRRGIVWRSRPLAAAGRSGRHGRACQAAVVKPVHRRSPREQQTAPGLSFGLNSPSSGIVHRRPPGSCSRSSRTVADAGEHRPTLLESVLGATPQEFESPILRDADLRRRARIMFACCATSRACVSFSVSVGPPGHMPYSGQTGVLARRGDPRCTWSETSRTYLDRRVHAAGACVPYPSGQVGPNHDYEPVL